MRRRLGLVAAVAVLAPVGAARVAAADDQNPATAAAPSSATPPPPSTTSPPTDPPSTTTPPPPSSTAPASSTTATPPPSSTPPATTGVPVTTTTVTTPPATTVPGPTPKTVPGTTTTTTVATGPATTAPDPTGPASTEPDDDHPTASPPAPPVQTPSGRVVVPAGTVETGAVRPITFPVAGPVVYANDFGACRDGCARAHQGNDIIGDRLQPLLAMHDGVVDHLVDHPTAGYGVVIRDGDGWEYRVYHVNNDSPGTDDGADDGTWRYAAGIVPGAPVRAGQLIAWMGDSGNSEGSVPHAHVEIHRPDGTAINPYWSLRLAQREINCSIATISAAADVADPAWLDSGWENAALPAGWARLHLTGGHPGSGAVAARMWIGSPGFTPVDAPALQSGDPRYHDPAECTRAPRKTPAVPAELGAVLATIRAIESGGDYTAESASSSASGAYQFVDGTWNGYRGYARASDAPPEVQDAKAAEWATAILARNGGDISTVPVSWYLGHVPVGSEWDTVPAQPGNRLTPREYQDLWMRQYAAQLGQPVDTRSYGAPGWTPVDTSRTCHTVVVDVGSADVSQLVLTQAQRFAVDPSGHAVPHPSDPCDPARGAPRPSPVEAVAVVDRRGSLGRG